MASSILWHGTPSPRPSAELGARPSLFEAFWLSCAPEVAANYAGMDGWVHGYVLAPEARILRATGHKDRPASLSYPDAGTWAGVSDFLLRRGCDFDYFDCLDAQACAAGIMPPLSPDGAPSWEGLLFDLSECSGDGEDLLRAMGLAGFLYTEQVVLALNDRKPDLSDPDHARLAAALRRRQDERVPTAAVLDPADLLPVCRLSARHVAQAYLAGHGLEATTPDDLARWAAVPAIPSPAPALA